MPGQAPGIRPSDILHKNSAAVQGIEASMGVYAYPLLRHESTLRSSTCYFLLPQRVLRKRAMLVAWIRRTGGVFYPALFVS